MLCNGWYRVFLVVLSVLLVGSTLGVMADDPEGSDGEHGVDLDESLEKLEDEAPADNSTSNQRLGDAWEAMFALEGDDNITDSEVDESVDKQHDDLADDLEGNVNEAVEQTPERVIPHLPKSAQSSAGDLEQKIKTETEGSEGSSSSGSSGSGSGSGSAGSSGGNDNSTHGNETSDVVNEHMICTIQILCGAPLVDHPRGMLPKSPLPLPDPGWSPGAQHLIPAGESPGKSEPVTPQQEAATPVNEQQRMTNAIVIATAAAATIAATAMVTAGTSAGSQVIAWATRLVAVAKRWFWVALGLYARLSKDQVLDHGTRNQILEFLRANPGASMTQIQSALQAGFTTIRHHLRVLQTNDLVTDIKNGRRRCFFAIENAGSRQERRATAVLASASAKRVFTVIERRPGIRQQELAAALNVSSTSVIFHTRRLEAAGVVQRGQSGRAIAYFPAETATV